METSSSNLLSLLTVCLCIIILYLILRLFHGREKLKGKKCPGPSLIQTYSGLFKMKGHVHKIFSEWAQTHGPFYQIFIGAERYFILNSVELIKETFSRIEMSERPQLVPLDPLFEGIKAILNGKLSEGLEHRNFALITLKKFGLGRSQMATQVGEEIGDMLMDLEGQVGQLICIKKRFLVPSMNALWLAVAGKRFLTIGPAAIEEDKNIIKIFKNFLENLEELALSPIAIHPTLLKYLPWLPVWKKYKKSYTVITSYFTRLVQQHRETRLAGEPRDFIDAYLDKSEEEEMDPNSVFAGAKNLVPCLVDFLVAGSDTSSLTLEWIVLVLAREETLQSKIRGQIHNIVGLDRPPTMADRGSLPLVDSLIWEVLRLFPPAPSGIPHQVTEEGHMIGGHVLPKNSNILINLHAAHRDEAVWGESADQFKPQRFLDSQGFLDKTIVDQQVPFSYGRRRCIGQDLAMDSLFLLTAGLIQKFSFERHPDHPLLLEGGGGFLMGPKKFSVILKSV